MRYITARASQAETAVAVFGDKNATTRSGSEPLEVLDGLDLEMLGPIGVAEYAKRVIDCVQNIAWVGTDKNQRAIGEYVLWPQESEIDWLLAGAREWAGGEMDNEGGFVLYRGCPLEDELIKAKYTELLPAKYSKRGA